ncbi:MAG: FAD-binding oxidoreductase [Mesorhizobium sp.]|nr:MAG: FAD-binding oxidoreductase [Mesorhizobium sp.]TIQ73848.1 MAG: FAD-binding oxidoreductase [Mesorhizobium sp.]
MIVARAWAGLIDVTPDANPVIEAVVKTPVFCVATGFSGYGFGIASPARRLMAELVTGSYQSLIPSGCRDSAPAPKSVLSPALEPARARRPIRLPNDDRPTVANQPNS